jgi:hypothetical protein
LLFIGKFYLPPFHIKLERSIELATVDQSVVIKGRIDFLLLNRQLWVTVIESKYTSLQKGYGIQATLA